MLRDNYIQRKFILERSPWWGGFYERLVGIMKSCLHKILGKKLLTFEELRALIYEIDCTLNLRPLTHVDEDFNNNILTLIILFIYVILTASVLTITLLQI